MEFANVIPGDRWQAEPAARYNAVNALLRAGESGNSNGGALPQYNFTVDVRNSSGKNIPAFMPVPLTRQLCKVRYPHFYAYEITADEPDFASWGVTTAEIPAGGTGQAAVAGLALAKFAVCENGKLLPDWTYLVNCGDGVMPTAAGLVAAGTGGGAVIAPPYYDSSSGQWLPGVVNLYGTYPAGGREEFFVRCVDVHGPVFRVENGMNPWAPICGTTIFPSCTNIGTAEITGSGALCLVISWVQGENGKAVYSYTLKFTGYAGVLNTEPQAFVFKLADCSTSGKVILNPGLKCELAMPGWLL